MDAKPKLAQVTTLYKSNTTDVVAMLRLLADDIESGNLGEIDRAICMVKDREGHVNHYGWGKLKLEEAHVMFALGARVTLSYLDKGQICDIPRVPTDG